MEIRRFSPADTRALIELFRNTVHVVCRRDYSYAQLEAWAPQDIDVDRWADRFNKKLARSPLKFFFKWPPVFSRSLLHRSWLLLRLLKRLDVRDGLSNLFVPFNFLESRLTVQQRRSQPPLEHLAASCFA